MLAPPQDSENSLFSPPPSRPISQLEIGSELPVARLKDAGSARVRPDFSTRGARKMTIGEVEQIRASGINSSRDDPEGHGPEQAARNREVIRAVRTMNEGQAFGLNSEARFAIDPDTGETLIKIVDRTTNEVITQVPPEAAFRLAAMVREARTGVRIA